MNGNTRIGQIASSATRRKAKVDPKIEGMKHGVRGMVFQRVRLKKLSPTAAVLYASAP